MFKIISKKRRKVITKHGKKVYIQKKFITLQNGDITIQIKSIKFTKMKKPIEKPVFDENTPGWNQDIQDVFKKYPPIPIEGEEKPTEAILEENPKWHPEENFQWNPYGLIRKYGKNRTPKGEPYCLNFLPTKYTEHKLSNNEVEEDKKDDVTNMLSDYHQKVKEHIEFLENLNIDADITLDLDDVIYDLMKRNISFVEEVYGVKDVHLEITDYYYLYRTYPRIAEELWNHPENYISSELIEGAIEFYNELVELVGGEDRIQIVTSSMENVIPLKNKMIKETFGFNCKVIHSIFGTYEKHIFTKGTFLIEDHVGNLKDHTTRNQCGGVIFNHMKLSYIEVLCKQEGFEHVTTYKEVLESVKSYLSVKKCLKNLNFI